MKFDVPFFPQRLGQIAHFAKGFGPTIKDPGLDLANPIGLFRFKAQHLKPIVKGDIQERPRRDGGRRHNEVNLKSAGLTQPRDTHVKRRVRREKGHQTAPLARNFKGRQRRRPFVNDARAAAKAFQSGDHFFPPRQPGPARIGAEFAKRAKAFGMIGAAFGLGFVIGPALGGLLGEYGARMPFYVAAGVSALNLVYGYFVLPETLAPSNRRAFEWQRANPLGTFKVFTTYHGVVPLSIVMFVYFFSSAVYPAIWAFWGIAKFGWSEWLVGLSLAAFGIVTAVFQGALTGPAVKLWGESKVALIGLVSAVIAAVGYGFAPGLLVVIIFFIVHGPEGFVHPMLTAIMSKAVPENAQGELQGGISSIMSVSMLLGTVFFSQVFGYFMQDSAPVTSPDMAFFVAAGLLVVTLAMFVVVRRRMAKSS